MSSPDIERMKELLAGVQKQFDIREKEYISEINRLKKLVGEKLLETQNSNLIQATYNDLEYRDTLPPFAPGKRQMKMKGSPGNYRNGEKYWVSPEELKNPWWTAA